MNIGAKINNAQEKNENHINECNQDKLSYNNDEKTS